MSTGKYTGRIKNYGQIYNLWQKTHKTTGNSTYYRQNSFRGEIYGQFYKQLFFGGQIHWLSLYHFIVIIGLRIRLAWCCRMMIWTWNVSKTSTWKLFSSATKTNGQRQDECTVLTPYWSSFWPPTGPPAGFFFPLLWSKHKTWTPATFHTANFYPPVVLHLIRQWPCDSFFFCVPPPAPP